MEKQEMIIKEYDGKSYMPVDRFGTWRVAIINECDAFEDENGMVMHRHMATDEVFVPIMGKSTMYIGPEKTAYEMEIGKVYNVKQGTWHATKVDKGGKVFVVENDDTDMSNSERGVL